MIQQSQTTCTNCRQGKVIPENKKCCKCGGIGTCKERKVLEVFIEKGAPDGHRIVFSGEADEKPDTIPGDVRFIIDQQVSVPYTQRNIKESIERIATIKEGGRISIPFPFSGFNWECIYLASVCFDTVYSITMMLFRNILFLNDVERIFL